MEGREYFDTVAELYDSARPGYPPLMVDDLLLFSGAGPGSAMLDIGCGTGKSTEPFVERGLAATALDPGGNMLAVCRRRLSRHHSVHYHQATFEDWQPDGAGFDLVISGTAFHWIDPSSHAKLLRVLKPGGWVGVFWHTFLNESGGFYDTLNEIYRLHAPAMYVPDIHAAQELADREKELQLLSWTGFGQWRVIRYYEAVRYDAQGYLDLLHTWSTHTQLPQAFFDAVADAIARHGGLVEKPIRTTLCVARRTAAASS
jgi:ubiquinone/menaquinone biosynthesis C-methylase UbiE